LTPIHPPPGNALIDNASDHAALGRAITGALTKPAAAADMGRTARQRVIDEYLVPTYLTRYLRLVEAVASGGTP